jgi:hypothetical protein
MREFAPGLPDPRIAFEMFRDRIGHWCVRRLDGLVFGEFRERQTAMRFAQRECRGTKRLVLIDRTAENNLAR